MKKMGYNTSTLYPLHVCGRVKLPQTFSYNARNDKKSSCTLNTFCLKFDLLFIYYDLRIHYKS